MSAENTVALDSREAQIAAVSLAPAVEVFPETYSMCQQVVDDYGLSRDHSGCYPRLTNETGVLVPETLRSFHDTRHWPDHFEGSVNDELVEQVHAQMDRLLSEGEFRVPENRIEEDGDYAQQWDCKFGLNGLEAEEILRWCEAIVH